MFEQLSQKELFEIYFDQIKSSSVIKYLDELNTESEYTNFLEHVIFLYWNCKIISRESITNAEIEQLLKYKKNNAYQNVVGELAKNNLLDDSRMEKLFYHLKVTDWGYAQCKARKKVNEIKKVKKIENQIDKEFLNLIFQKKISWALEEIINYISKNELRWLYNEINREKYFTKTNRHNLLQKIQPLIKLC